MSADSELVARIARDHAELSELNEVLRARFQALEAVYRELVQAAVLARAVIYDVQRSSKVSMGSIDNVYVAQISTRFADEAAERVVAALARPVPPEPTP